MNNIVIIDNFSSIIEYLTDIKDPNAMVIFDVDDVIIRAKDQLLRGAHFDYTVKIKEDLATQHSEELVQDWYSTILLAREIELVHHLIPVAISRLQEQGNKVLALTLMKTGKHGKIITLEDWRIKELRNLGIDFAKGLPLSYIEFQNFDFVPLFKEGILFSAENDKGDVFHEFLKHIPFIPPYVVFIDDIMDNVESMQKACANNNIKFLGFHYTFKDTELNPNLINSQMDYLVKYSEWINEEDIKDKLREGWSILL